MKTVIITKNGKTMAFYPMRAKKKGKKINEEPRERKSGSRHISTGKPFVCHNQDMKIAGESIRGYDIFMVLSICCSPFFIQLKLLQT